VAVLPICRAAMLRRAARTRARQRRLIPRRPAVRSQASEPRGRVESGYSQSVPQLMRLCRNRPFARVGRGLRCSGAAPDWCAPRIDILEVARRLVSPYVTVPARCRLDTPGTTETCSDNRFNASWIGYFE